MLGHVAVGAESHEVREGIVTLLAPSDLVVNLKIFQRPALPTPLAIVFEDVLHQPPIDSLPQLDGPDFLRTSVSKGSGGFAGEIDLTSPLDSEFQIALGLGQNLSMRFAGVSGDRSEFLAFVSMGLLEVTPESVRSVIAMAHFSPYVQTTGRVLWFKHKAGNQELLSFSIVHNEWSGQRRLFSRFDSPLSSQNAVQRVGGSLLIPGK